MTDLRNSPGRILLVTPQPFYEDRGTPIAVHLLLKVLSDLGYTVDVVASDDVDGISKVTKYFQKKVDCDRRAPVLVKRLWGDEQDTAGRIP